MGKMLPYLLVGNRIKLSAFSIDPRTMCIMMSHQKWQKRGNAMVQTFSMTLCHDATTADDSISSTEMGCTWGNYVMHNNCVHMTGLLGLMPTRLRIIGLMGGQIKPIKSTAGMDCASLAIFTTGRFTTTASIPALALIMANSYIGHSWM